MDADGPALPSDRSAGPTLASRVVALEPLNQSNLDELMALDRRRIVRPELGGWFVRLPPADPMALLLVRQLASGAAVGTVEANPLPGYSGVVNASIFVDAELIAGSRFTSAAVAMHAYGLHTSLQFDLGARLVHHEVLECTTVVHSLMARMGVDPSARMREHAYVAGRWWDVLVYSFDAEQWARYRSDSADRHLAFMERVAAREIDAPGGMPC